MPAERIVIVGAGPAGLATARSYREHGGRGRVSLVGEEPLLPYQRPPLTKQFLRGEMREDELQIERAEWFAAHDVELCLGTPVATIDSARGVVALGDGRELHAEVVVLATGSEPVRPPVPGAEHEGALTMRRLADARSIAARAGGGARPAQAAGDDLGARAGDGPARAHGGGPARAGGDRRGSRVDRGHGIVVIGSGFIGCEVAGSLAALGAQVTLVSEERLPQEDRLGAQAAERIAGWLHDLGVTLVGGVSLAAIEDGPVVELEDGRQVRGSCAVLGDDRRLAGACVVLATGVRPRSELAERAGLVRKDDPIPVDAAMRSSDPAVLAVGDVALAHNLLAGRAIRVEHWGDALGHGKVAGRTLAGVQAAWDEVPGFWSTIGEHTLKYAAWGDGYDELRIHEHDDGAFTVWYAREGTTVGVLTHRCDENYEHGRERVAAGDPLP